MNKQDNRVIRSVALESDQLGSELHSNSLELCDLGQVTYSVCDSAYPWNDKNRRSLNIGLSERLSKLIHGKSPKWWLITYELFEQIAWITRIAKY